MTGRRHSMPFGAQLDEDGAVRYRLWAPAASRVELCLADDHGERMTDMTDVGDGWYQRVMARHEAAHRYHYRINGGLRVPDPASRFQPSGLHGYSEVIDAQAFDWRDHDWRGRPWHEAVIYELHVGAFTADGNYAGVERRLDHLAELGVTALQLMPLAAFPGKRNWGYDGALAFAPDASYGRPEDLKRLVQSAHARGLMVLLDVVYNHFGPEGNYLHLYAPQFFNENHRTPWGAAINFDAPGASTVREFFVHNALYWLEEYHLDGLRLDAVHAIADDSSPDILEQIATAVHAGSGSEREIHLVLENDHNAAHYLRVGSGRKATYRAQWNDDFHHVLHLLATGESDGYYADYVEQPLRHLARVLCEGFAYQGEISAYRHDRPRGEPSGDLACTAFVNFLQNHDQVGNRAFGERIGALSPTPVLRTIGTLLLLGPAPPLLFMGQEFAADSPFLYFCDFEGELAKAVAEGRRREFARFQPFADDSARLRIPDPNAPATYERSRLDWSEIQREPYQDWLEWHRYLLRLRHHQIVPHLRDAGTLHTDCALCGAHGLKAEWRFRDGGSLHLLANLGDGALDPVAVTLPRWRQLLHREPPDLDLNTLQQLPPWSAIWWMLMPDESAQH